MSSNLLLGFFYWNSMIQKGVCVMTSSEWEVYVAAKLLANSKHLKGVSTFLLILDKKTAYSWDFKGKNNIGIAS